MSTTRREISDRPRNWTGRGSPRIRHRAWRRRHRGLHRRRGRRQRLPRRHLPTARGAGTNDPLALRGDRPRRGHVLRHVRTRVRPLVPGPLMLFLATAGVVTIDGTVIVELITFLVMLAILARYVYPRIVEVAEARQRAIAQQLKEAEEARAAAQAQLEEATAKLNDARKSAQSVLDAAAKSAEQLRQELRQKADEEAKRSVENARKQIEAERDQAIRTVRTEVADLVVTATEKVIGETLDDAKHRRLIERAIEEVASGDGSR